MLDVHGLHLRAAFFRGVRSFLVSRGFLEVDTPIRQPVILPEANIVPVEAEAQFLQSSPELCMKRLLACGCSRIFQICPCFRKEERGRLHLEEFQMLEWYRSGGDYHQLMLDCEGLLRHLQEEMQHQLQDGERNLFPNTDLSGEWQRLRVADAFQLYSPLSLDEALARDCFDEILVEHIEPKLGLTRPLFLYDYPVSQGSLAKRIKTDPNYVERFELYIKGIEVANGFSELTDEKEQRERFHHELEQIRTARGVEATMPERFLEDLQKLDQAAGIALGLDRLFMLALGSTTLHQVVTFSPQDF